MHSEVVILALFCVATAVALVARRFKLPYTVALVIAGLVLGSIRLFEPPHLTKDLLYAVFLPGLLFEAAFHLEFRRFWQNKIAVFSLAIPGVIAAVALTTLLLVPSVNVLGLPSRFTMREGLAFAALIAATDPIAVVALFKTLGAPKRLAVLIEGESLLNDGTAVVIFTLILSFVLGKPTSMPVAALDFVRVVGMGVLIGGLVGYAASFFIHKVDDPMIEMTLTTVAAYGSFIGAEHFHFSGVIATVTAGMLCGNHAATTGMSASTRVAVTSFWEYLAFALNSLIFLLIGFEVQFDQLLSAWKAILVAYLAVTIARAAVTHLVALALRRTREHFPLKWASVLTWGGLRGALSMVLALGLPPDFEQRPLVISMTFGVVILSILVQGVTMSPLLRRLKLVKHSRTSAERDRLRGAVQSARAALVELDEIHERGILAKEAISSVREEYEARIRDLEKEATALREKSGVHLEDDIALVKRQALVAEKDSIVTAYRSGEIAEESYERLLANVDARLFELETDEDVRLPQPP